ncbi:hypothetical protein EfmAA96_32190 (plasmid) [Enterococcus faecium]|nr:hypothetical protein EfmAA96_32190 [Enterococcus faecium]
MLTGVNDSTKETKFVSEVNRAAQELYENTLITDIHTAAKVYGNTEDTAVYQDATFFVKGDKNLDSVIKDLGKLDINWREYNLIKSSSNYPALQQSISGIYSISNTAAKVYGNTEEL